MKWFALAGALLAAVVAFLVLRGSPPEPPVQATVAPVQPPVATTPPPGAHQAAVAARRHWVMAGAMVDARDPSRSQALIGVDGEPPRLLRTGDPIDTQWRLGPVRSDSATVVHASGERVDVPLTAGTPGAAPVATAAPSVPDKPLPGFTPGPMPAAVLAPGAAAERNRRFVQDRQNAAGSATTH